MLVSSKDNSKITVNAGAYKSSKYQMFAGHFYRCWLIRVDKFNGKSETKMTKKLLYFSAYKPPNRLLSPFPQHLCYSTYKPHHTKALQFKCVDSDVFFLIFEPGRYKFRYKFSLMSKQRNNTFFIFQVKIFIVL